MSSSSLPNCVLGAAILLDAFPRRAPSGRGLRSLETANRARADLFTPCSQPWSPRIRGEYTPRSSPRRRAPFPPRAFLHRRCRRFPPRPRLDTQGGDALRSQREGKMAQRGPHESHGTFHFPPHQPRRRSGHTGHTRRARRQPRNGRSRRGDHPLVRPGVRGQVRPRRQPQPIHRPRTSAQAPRSNRPCPTARRETGTIHERVR